jgi:PAS domain-containing protein
MGQGRAYIRGSNSVKTLRHAMNDDGPTLRTASVGDQRVLRERDQFRALANAVPQLVWMADASGSVYWYNQRWYDFTGTTPRSDARMGLDEGSPPGPCGARGRPNPAVL